MTNRAGKRPSLSRIGAAGFLLLMLAAPMAAADRKPTDVEILSPTTDFTRPERFEHMSAGDATSRRRIDASAYSHGSATMGIEREPDFKTGNGLFRRVWLSAPSSTPGADGLGPLFNARSCERCHLKDGRGHPPDANWLDDNAVSMLLRLSIPPRTDAERKAIESGKMATIPEPTYGLQLQDLSIQRHRAEGRMHILYSEETVLLSGGESVRLRKPTYKVTDLGYGPMHPKTMLSPRVAPPMIGLGLIEAIPEELILALADPDDRDRDGISGKANSVWSQKQNKVALGRFGWKAGSATIEDQAAAAFSSDIGISTPLFLSGAGDCTDRQTACRAAPSGNRLQQGEAEAPQKVLDLVLFYSRNLAVPARRKVGGKDVLAGKQVFYESGCIACHRPKFITRTNPPGMPEQSRQLIWPYTDLLLHDMGNGLADNRPEGRADGREWRTAPLWGIGLTETVNGHTYFLHDGRARNLLEAILWHGGEAEKSKDKVVRMPPDDRRNLILFLESL